MLPPYPPRLLPWLPAVQGYLAHKKQWLPVVQGYLAHKKQWLPVVQGYLAHKKQQAWAVTWCASASMVGTTTSVVIPCLSATLGSGLDRKAQRLLYHSTLGSRAFQDRQRK